MKDNRKQDRVMTLVVLALIAVVTVVGVHRWYMSDERRQRQYWDDFAAMPSVEQVDPDTLQIRLTDDATVDKARSALDAIDRDQAGTSLSPWFLSLGAAELPVRYYFGPSDAACVDLLALLGTAEALDAHDVDIEISPSLADSAMISLDGPDAHDVSTTTTVIDVLATHRDLPPEITISGGPGVTTFPAEALRDPDQIKGYLAMMDEVADLDPWVSLTTAERHVWVRVDRRDAASTRERLRSALANAPEQLDIVVTVDDD
jgi:hypothetical protein